jgi:hypothetical protein
MLAYVLYVHIYVEQGNHLDNLASLQILLFPVTVKKDMDNTDITGICFLTLQRREHYASI